MADNRKPQDQPRGGGGVLGDKQSFKKDEGHDQTTEQWAKDEIGHMGEKSGQGKRPIDVD
ncbi:hypothetical protein HL658_18200 [Azospirillum sp. RWY-5-1]|uniref:Uncharacterized protein n=1 Tax=Azospirillum oleiclasticum TaxID=2735135 RepID=A0ABX2TFP6_9PROT|nr:hypothetical protein [Azospirillum oleiclasticum]NYZ14486.1 hypothetical protein [Azospirillum oleiclasticum]NYZ23162.1 hypothetical protein [Azospirillum oleiclasticum]